MDNNMNENKMIVCKACNRFNDSGGNFCVYCGAALEFTDAEKPPAGQVHQSAGNNIYGNNADTHQSGSQYGPPPRQSSQGLMGLSIASFVCGIISTSCLVLPMGGAAIITGVLALVKKQQLWGLAVAGIIIAALSLLFHGGILLLSIIGLMVYN